MHALGDTWVTYLQSRCDLKSLTTKTVEITKKDVVLNNLLQRSKSILHAYHVWAQLSTLGGREWE